MTMLALVVLEVGTCPPWIGGAKVPSCLPTLGVTQPRDDDDGVVADFSAARAAEETGDARGGQEAARISKRGPGERCRAQQGVISAGRDGRRGVGGRKLAVGAHAAGGENSQRCRVGAGAKGAIGAWTAVRECAAQSGSGPRRNWQRSNRSPRLAMAMISLFWLHRRPSSRCLIMRLRASRKVRFEHKRISQRAQVTHTLQIFPDWTHRRANSCLLC